MATIRRLDDTQAEFAEGTLVGVQATATPSLALAYRPVLSFDGVDDYVDISSVWSNFTQDNTPFTLECWFKADVVNGQTELIDIGRGNDKTGFRLLFVSDVLYGQTMDGTTRYSITGGTLAANLYYYASFTFNGTNMNLYLDGNSIAAPVSGTWVQDTVAYIGMQASLNWFFKGNISEVRIWNTARTQQQIQDNMYKELTGTEPGLVAYYRLDEGTGTVATDSAGTNNGTIYGATWTTSSSFYMSSGYRVTPPLDCTDLTSISSSSVSWTEILNSQTITIETRVSTDNGNTWTAWTQVTNGGSIPDIAPGCLVECRQNLSTTDISKTPELTSLDVEINGVTTTLMFACNF